MFFEGSGGACEGLNRRVIHDAAFATENVNVWLKQRAVLGTVLTACWWLFTLSKEDTIEQLTAFMFTSTLNIYDTGCDVLCF